MTDHRAAVFAQVSGLPRQTSTGFVQVCEPRIAEDSLRLNRTGRP